MNDIYVTKSGMTKEQMFRLRLINGFNFAPIIADAIVDLSKDFFQNDNSGICNGQILYLAISDEEGPGKSVLDSKHVEVILTLDAPEDMEVYEKFGLSAYRQHILLRSRHRTNYAQVSIGCLDFQDHYHQLKINFMKNTSNLFCDSC